MCTKDIFKDFKILYYSLCQKYTSLAELSLIYVPLPLSLCMREVTLSDSSDPKNRETQEPMTYHDPSHW